jgi:hypothetical protein
VAFDSKRAELTAAISELHRLQMESMKEATFGGWTCKSEAAYEIRAARIAALLRELAVIE